MITIENYNKEVGMMWVYGWDLEKAEEMDDAYIFQLAKRPKPEHKVWFTLGRKKQYAESPYYPEQRYQLYMSDQSGNSTERIWLEKKDLSYFNLGAIIEGVLNKHFGHA
jgi:hypothetical protein